jgi:4-amino-4-deoxy-L-arabinose transferase-like glycosyltransferase
LTGSGWRPLLRRVRGRTPGLPPEYGWPPPGRRRILRGVLARVRKWFDGAGWFVGAAVVLLVVSLLAVLAELQVPEHMLWTGQQVTGTEQQGLVYYRWQGQSYSVDVQGFGSSKAVSVYFNPGDPSQAIVDNVPDRVLTGLFVLGPAAGAVVLLVIGGTRNYRWQRRKLRRAREFRL